MRDARETARTTSDRYLELVEHRIAPALEPFGFVRQRALFERFGGDVDWIVELELAPWATPEKICFTLGWGVNVPGLDEILGDDAIGPPSRAGQCPINARVGEGTTGLEARWFTVGPVRVPGLERVADARTSQSIVRLIDRSLMPTLLALDSIPAVQSHLVERLVRGRGAAREGELRRIRWIAGLSLLLDERENASRWLDYLQARSSVSIAPDVVTERLAALRQRCAS